MLADTEIIERIAANLNLWPGGQLSAKNHARNLLPVVKRLMLEARIEQHKSDCERCEPCGFDCKVRDRLERELAALEEKT